MGILKVIKQRCQNCNEYFVATGCAVCNGTLDIDLKEKFQNSSMFDFKCPHCGHTFRSIYSMQYRDAEKEYMILLDCGDIDKEKIIKEVLTDFPNYRIRVVSDPIAMLEKIHIFGADLNDKIITYLDHCIFQDITNGRAYKKLPLVITKIFFDSCDLKSGLINFEAISDSTKPIFVSESFKKYEYFLQHPIYYEQFKELDGEYNIDDNWAEKISTLRKQFRENRNRVTKRVCC
ncbi:CpXC domain-containing protein [Acetobacterium bakii]|uniref:CpXC domain-containing protein n=1 Tax=Acetobacterium bakii TaxID=52689 RepID=A0A0L6TZX7_9FIRM|nr:CpXC domain-containing protein [Acetobacterium bakii]KNZ41125.1 hypothetical protein AKG39_13685 [Acetobacterium bakii]